ncbi:MAG: hypothetical protein Q9221_003238 [Calogaya cf. arnoldii]
MPTHQTTEASNPLPNDNVPTLRYPKPQNPSNPFQIPRFRTTLITFDHCLTMRQLIDINKSLYALHTLLENQANKASNISRALESGNPGTSQAQAMEKWSKEVECLGGVCRMGYPYGAYSRMVGLGV